MRKILRFIDENQPLSGMVLCCVVLVLVYVEVRRLSRVDDMPDGFAISWQVFGLMALLALTLWVTWRGSRTCRLPSAVPEWAVFGAFVLTVSNSCYALLPKSFHDSWDVPLHSYLLPVVFLGGAFTFLLMVGIAKAVKRQKEERRLRMLEHEEFVRQLNAPSSDKEHSLVRLLLENRSIMHLSRKELLRLVSECRVVDAPFFRWLREEGYADVLKPREILYCVLVRMYKGKEDIRQILGLEEGSYRTFKSRLAAKLREQSGIGDDMTEFLRSLQ